MIRLSYFSLPIVFSCLSVPASANVNIDDPLIVTASRSAKTLSQALAPVTVITHQDIMRNQAESVPELLAHTPGLVIVSSGGLGSQTSLSLRGTKSNQTVILIDGIRINSAITGAAALQNLDPEQIERIEIVRGAQSSLYGADAVGGVIQIFTRQPKGKPAITAQVGIGTENTQRMQLNYGGQIGATRFNLGVGQLSTAGYDSTNRRYPVDTGVNRDNDGYRRKSYVARIAHTFANQSKASLSLMHDEGKSEYDSYLSNANYTANEPYNAYGFFHNTSVNARYTMPINTLWQTQWSLGWSENYQRDLGKDIPSTVSFEPSSFGTRRSTISWINDVAWQAHQRLTLGTEYWHEQALGSADYRDSDTQKTVDERDNTAIFLQNQSQMPWGDIKLGVRTDHNNTYGNNTTGNIAWGMALPKRMRVIASYATAFREPTFSDLYYPGTAWHGNPHLKPETARNKEITLRGYWGLHRWSIGVFQNDIDDLIESGNTTAYNISQARIRGLEATYQMPLGHWQGQANLELLDPKDRTANKTLPRVPKQRLVVDLHRKFTQWTLGGSLQAQSKTRDSTYSPVELAGFYTLGFRLQRKINAHLSTSIKIVNALNADYQVASGYRAQPRALLLSFSWHP